MLVRLFSIMVAGSAVVAAGGLGLMVSERTPPIETYERIVVTPKVRPGMHLEWKIRLFEKKRCFIHTDRTIYDSKGERYIIPPVEFHAGMGAPEQEMEYIVQVRIPYEINFGPAKLYTSTIYRCNPIHWLWPIYSLPLEPIEFEVVPL